MKLSKLFSKGKVTVSPLPSATIAATITNQHGSRLMQAIHTVESDMQLEERANEIQRELDKLAVEDGRVFIPATIVKLHEKESDDLSIMLSKNNEQTNRRINDMDTTTFISTEIAELEQKIKHGEQEVRHLAELRTAEKEAAASTHDKYIGLLNDNIQALRREIERQEAQVEVVEQMRKAQVDKIDADLTNRVNSATTSLHGIKAHLSVLKQAQAASAQAAQTTQSPMQGVGRAPATTLELRSAPQSVQAQSAGRASRVETSPTPVPHLATTAASLDSEMETELQNSLLTASYSDETSTKR